MPDVALRGPAGRLVARHDPPEAPPPARGPLAAVVCHPHPLYGGTLENKVVHSVARALREGGLHVLRFNFRGAGGSDGIHDGGAGEVDDARVRKFIETIRDLRLREGEADRVLVHCTTGDRVAALWAMYEITDGKVPPEEAVARARKAGLTSAELVAYIGEYSRRIGAW